MLINMINEIRILCLVVKCCTTTHAVLAFDSHICHIELTCVLQGYYLHYNYVVGLLNDLFGLQTRGGCACAGPYSQSLLGIGNELAHTYENLLLEDRCE
jgi:hypothetical protein